MRERDRELTDTAPLTQTEPLRSVRREGGDDGFHAGDRIGPFLLMRQIGAGGMGVVFLAEQTEPLQRQVALKLMAPNFADAYASAMFLVERQALARLEHPCIARVYEAGSTDHGELYFAMEWIDGERIDRHCARAGLQRDAILRLMIDVCRGVQHAHLRGVVHRDLKPANVLVAEVDGAAVPKIIDFGIAGAPGRGESTLGTQGYMAPEQMQAGELVDQRADVYALGVLLLELLTHSVGVDQHSWWDLDAVARERMLLTGRASEPLQRRLVAQLPRDLRAVIARALRPDREQRYSGAEALAEDLQRYLRGFPVHSRPRTGGYVLARFVGRHRLLMSVGVLVLAAILGLLASATLAWRAAEREALKAAQTAGFLRSVLAGVDPKQAEGLDRSLMRHILDSAAARVGRELEDAPEVRAEVVRTIADTYRALGESALALQLIEPLHAEVLARRGPDATTTLVVEESLLDALRATGQIERARALATALYEREARVLGVHADQTLKTAAVLLRFMHEAGELEQARQFGTQRVAEIEAGSAPEAAATLHEEMAQTWSRLGDHARAFDSMRRAVSLLRRQRGPDDLRVIAARTEIGVMHFQAKQYPEALALWRELLPSYERVFGPEHSETLSVRGNIASALTMTGAAAEASIAFEELTAIRRRLHGAEHPETLIAIGNLAAARYRSKDHAGAEAAFREYVGLCERLYQARHPSCAERRGGLGKALRELGRYAESETELLRAHQLKGEVQGNQFASQAQIADELAELYRRWGKPELAAQWQARGSQASPP